jgi:hypothetical protein
MTDDPQTKDDVPERTAWRRWARRLRRWYEGEPAEVEPGPPLMVRSLSPRRPRLAVALDAAVATVRRRSPHVISGVAIAVVAGLILWWLGVGG